MRGILPKVLATSLMVVLLGAALAGATPGEAEDGLGKAREHSGRDVPSGPPDDVPRNASATGDDAGEDETGDHADEGPGGDASGNETSDGDDATDAHGPSESRGQGLATAIEHVPDHVAAKLAVMQAAFADGASGLGEILRLFREADDGEADDDANATAPATHGKPADVGKPDATGKPADAGRPEDAGASRGAGLARALGHAPAAAAGRLSAIAGALADGAHGVGATLRALVR